jgi:hypothetical protein
MKKPMHRLLLLVLPLSCSSLAFAGDDVPSTSNSMARYTIITNQYAAEGVTFFNAIELVSGPATTTAIFRRTPARA